MDTGSVLASFYSEKQRLQLLAILYNKPTVLVDNAICRFIYAEQSRPYDRSYRPGLEYNHEP